MGKILSLRGVVLLERLPGRFTVAITKGCPANSFPDELPIPRIPRTITSVAGKDARRLRWISAFRNAGMHYAVPLTVRNRVIGVAGFGPRTGSARLNSRESTYVRSMANIAAAAIEKEIIINELRDVNRKLDGKIHELNTLFELSKEFNALLDADRVVRLLTFSILGQVGVNRYAICMQRNGQMQTVASRLDGPIPESVCGGFHELQEPVLVGKLAGKEKPGDRQELEKVGIRVLVPLKIHNTTRGMIGLGDKISGQPYSPADLEFLAALGNLAIISLENARLFKEALEKQKMEDELVIAKEIQRGLLPSSLPEIPGFEFAASSLSSKQVGGDYYDVIPLRENRFVIAIGDVSGKGTPAALLMANLQAAIRALVPLNLPLPELTGRVNDLIADNTGSGRFITFFWGVLDPDGRTLQYVNAGHNPPYLFHRDGSFERLEKGGLILGVMKTTRPYEGGSIGFSPGDVLLLFTDGVSEAMDHEGVEFGEGPLEQVTCESLTQPSASILERIVEKVREHSRGVTQSDDITLLVLRHL
jgi:sigma-B regulation protein RsbU (phosphoserine phosphatase)